MCVRDRERVGGGIIFLLRFSSSVRKPLHWPRCLVEVFGHSKTPVECVGDGRTELVESPKGKG
eukprot:scaffold1806_cov240-Pinguiococcus_pyrenoidosus.AAC.6